MSDPIVLKMRNVVCVLGHTQRAMECPACGEAFTGLTAKPEHWRWYRERTSSKRIKAALDQLLALRAENDLAASSQADNNT